jgi:hypothetical protein
MKPGTLVQLLVSYAQNGSVHPVEGMIGVVIGPGPGGRVRVCWNNTPDEGGSWPWGRLKVLCTG